jgi:hypothetical protein
MHIFWVLHFHLSLEQFTFNCTAITTVPHNPSRNWGILPYCGMSNLFYWYKPIFFAISYCVTAVPISPSCHKISVHQDSLCGLGSVVGIATGYRLDSPGIESQWGETFRTCPDRPWSPPNLLYNGYQVFPRGKERPGHDTDPSPPYSAMIMNE